jgi:hypothetical protein
MSVRIPLHVGTSSYQGVVGACVALLPGGCALGWLVVDARYDDALVGPVRVWIGTFALAALAYALTALVRAVRSFPADLVVGEEGLTLDGGRRARFLAWRDIDPTRSTFEQRLEWHVTGELLALTLLFPVALIMGFFALLNALLRVEQDVDPRVLVHRLVLRDARGAVKLRATVEDLADAEALAAVLSLAEARAAALEVPVADAQTKVRVASCSTCGAPCETEPYGPTLCRHCGTAFTPPREVVPLVRDEARLEEERDAQERLLASLLARRDVRSIRRRIVALGLVGLALDVAAFGFATDFELPIPSGTPLLRLVGLAAMTLLALGYAAQAPLRDRRAVHVLATHHAARAPKTRHGRPLCHTCGAPLEPRPFEVTQVCSHCRTENVLGLDLRAHVEASRRDTGSLRELVAEHARERRSARRRAFAGAVALAVLLPMFVSEATDAQDALARVNVVWTKRSGFVRRGGVRAMN